jgi:hypothetical protein
MNKDGYLEDGIRVPMDELNLVVVKESVQEIIGKKPKSTMEGGKHYNFFSVGCGDVFPSSGSPL